MGACRLKYPNDTSLPDSLFEPIGRDSRPVRIRNKMDQRSIVLYLARKGLWATEIDNDLVVTLGSNTEDSSSVTCFLHEAIFLSPNPPITFSEENLSLDDSNEAVLLTFNEQPFASIHSLSKLTHLPRSTIDRWLTQSLGFHVCHLRSASHGLTTARKSDRVGLSRQLLSMLEIQRVRCWHNIVTLDESWFYLSTDHDMIWLQSDEKVPGREKHTVQSKTMDAHDRGESQRLVFHQCSFQWVQVEREPLRNQYSWSPG
jgi:hypothetical protein